MQRGWITLTLAAFLVVVFTLPVYAPEPVLEPQRAFTAPPPLPVRKPADPATPSVQAVPQQAALRINDNELHCLALTVYWEANNEPVEGQLAVAHVVLNRVGRNGFANTICDVVHQGGPHFPCQFHWYCSGNKKTPKNNEGWSKAQLVARQALAEADTTAGAIYFHLASLKPSWAKEIHQERRQIGHHVFFGGNS